MTPEEVAAARKRLGLTQAELASWLELEGVHAKDTVRKWESGARPISGPARVAIKAFLAGYRPVGLKDPAADPQ